LIDRRIDLAVLHGHAALSVEAEGRWLGGVRLKDLLEVPAEAREKLRVADLARPVEVRLPSRLSALDALRQMEQAQSHPAAVVLEEDPTQVLGLVARRGLRTPALDIAEFSGG
jgi:CBS domain containing-hemolysin-like protein